MCNHLRDQHHVLCPHCDLLVTQPPLKPGQKGLCPRCRNTLECYWNDPKGQPVGFAISALMMQGLANLFPFVNMEISSMKRQITLPQIPQVMINDHFSSLACLFLLCVQVIPAFCMIIIILLCMDVPLPFRLKAFLAKLLFALRSWGMAEILLVGVVVSIVKLMAYGQIGIGNSFVPFCVFCVLQLRALQCVDPRWLWNVMMLFTSPVKAFRVGEGGLVQGIRACSCCTLILHADAALCPRCRTREGARRINSLQWTLALLCASMVLYIPANLLPIMITDGLGNRLNSTIMSGIIVLWQQGSIPVALMLFIASIMLPSLKMLALGWLCWEAAGYSERKASESERMHLVYEVVEFIGRWSMLDVFVIAVLSGLVRMGRLINISPGIGVLLFTEVIILTMIAAKTFDPRLLWDRASHTTLKESSIDRK